MIPEEPLKNFLHLGWVGALGNVLLEDAGHPIPERQMCSLQVAQSDRLENTKVLELGTGQKGKCTPGAHTRHTHIRSLSREFDQKSFLQEEKPPWPQVSLRTQGVKFP